MFIYLSESELFQLSCNSPKDIIITVDNSIIGKKELISKISHGINSPYLEDNWDGLEEALSDLSWIFDGTIRIIHQDLPRLSDTDLIVYVSILESVVHSWDSTNKNVYRQDLKVYFLDSLKQSIEKIFESLSYKDV